MSYAAAALIGIAAASPVRAAQVTLKKGTTVKLAFESDLNSRTAHAGQIVHFKVDEPVVVNGTTIIPAGTPETGRVEEVHHHGRYGVNARIRLAMDPIKAANGRMVPIGFKNEGPVVSGRTGAAAAATVGGAAVLGPIGLVGGYFIVGKTVNAKPGDKMTVQVDRDVTLNVR